MTIQFKKLVYICNDDEQNDGKICLQVKSKIDMLDSLLEIEVAYHLLSDNQIGEGKDPIDAHYEKLNTEISVLNKEEKEFKVKHNFF